MSKRRESDSDPQMNPVSDNDPTTVATPYMLYIGPPDRNANS